MPPVLSLLLALLVGSAALARAQTPHEDFFLVPVLGNASSLPASVNFTVLPSAGGPGYDGYLFIVENAAPHFKALPPLHGHPCNGPTKTSVTAQAHNCTLATNGGPFQIVEGKCIGLLATNSTWLQADFDVPFQFFGLTSKSEWIVGSLVETSLKKVSITEGLSGFTWLLRNGRNMNPAKGDTQPTNAIGVDAKGRLMVLQVDGCAGCAAGDQGPTLHQVGELLLAQGAIHAIYLNMDAYSVAYYTGQVVSKPTCRNTATPICEAPVTDIVCVL